MKTSAIIEGLMILRPYYDDHDGFNVGCEHDQLFAYATDKPLSPEDANKMFALGWFQPDVDSPDDDENGAYDPEESWSAYT